MIKKLIFVLAFFLSPLFCEIISLPTANNGNINFEIKNEHIDFYGYQGKYVLLEYFGTKCPMCQMEVEHLKNLVNTTPSVKVIAVELQNTPLDKLRNFIANKGINYPVIDFQNAYPLYMFAKNVIRNWQGQIPLAILFNRNGDALTYFIGVISKNDIIQAIKQYAGEDLNANTKISTNGGVSN